MARRQVAPRGPFLGSIRMADEAPDGYPFDLPAVRHIGDIRFEDVTVLVGDNGSGKSTIVEAIAVQAGFNPEGLRCRSWDSFNCCGSSTTPFGRAPNSWLPHTRRC